MTNFDFLLTEPKFEALSQAVVNSMKKLSVFGRSKMLLF